MELKIEMKTWHAAIDPQSKKKTARIS